MEGGKHYDFILKGVPVSQQLISAECNWWCWNYFLTTQNKYIYKSAYVSFNLKEVGKNIIKLHYYDSQWPSLFDILQNIFFCVTEKRMSNGFRTSKRKVNDGRIFLGDELSLLIIIIKHLVYEIHQRMCFNITHSFVKWVDILYLYLTCTLLLLELFLIQTIKQENVSSYNIRGYKHNKEELNTKDSMYRTRVLCEQTKATKKFRNSPNVCMILYSHICLTLCVYVALFIG